MSSPETRDAKKAIRREIFAAIRGLGDDKKSEFSAEICRHLRESAVFKKARSIGVYIAVKSEPDLSDLIWNEVEKSFSLARISEDGTLRFHKIESEADLVMGVFGIAEPHVETCPPIAEIELDLILVPGVGFDSTNGARLGRGKGHYDRFLEKVRQHAEKCTVIGVSFEIQHQPLTPESHDQPMNGLVCESGLVWIA